MATVLGQGGGWQVGVHPLPSLPFSLSLGRAPTSTALTIHKHHGIPNGLFSPGMSYLLMHRTNQLLGIFTRMSHENHEHDQTKPLFSFPCPLSTSCIVSFQGIPPHWWPKQGSMNQLLANFKTHLFLKSSSTNHH